MAQLWGSVDGTVMGVGGWHCDWGTVDGTVVGASVDDTVMEICG